MGKGELMNNQLLAVLKMATKENPANRFVLAGDYGLTERQVRLDISDLRKSGYRICADSSTQGYWMAESEKDYQRFRAEYISRATKIFDTVRAMDSNINGQIEVEL